MRGCRLGKGLLRPPRRRNEICSNPMRRKRQEYVLEQRLGKSGGRELEPGLTG